MSPESLLQQFEQISEAPDSILHLRRFILDLAVRGTLDTNNNDESVSSAYVVEPTIDKLPVNWRSLYFGKHFDIEGGNQPPKSKFSNEPKPGYVRLFQIRDLGKNPVPVYISSGSTNRFCKRGEILIGRYGASVGKIFWAQDGAYNVALAKFIFPPDAYIAQFAFLLLKSDYFQSGLLGASRSAQAGFNKGDLSAINLPLPPLAEQHRIVTKVDELMKLCDELEAAQAKRERRRDLLVAATLHGLNNGEANDENGETLSFEESARFYINHLPRLTTRPDHIQQLRQAILNLAVRGKLVPQDSNDEPVAEFLKRTQAQKKRPVVGKGRSSQDAAAIAIGETPFKVPSSWLWVSLSCLTASMTNGIYKPSSFYSDDGVLCLRMYNIRDGAINFESPKRILVDDKELEAYELKPGDLLVNRVNSRELVGKAAVIPNTSEKLIFESKNIRVRLIDSVTLPRYCNLLFQTDLYRKIIEGYSKQACGQATVSQPQLAKLPVPMAPLAEQHRIVAKVDELMKLCNELDSRITNTSTTRRQLLEAALHEALAS